MSIFSVGLQNGTFSFSSCFLPPPTQHRKKNSPSPFGKKMFFFLLNVTAAAAAVAEKILFLINFLHPWHRPRHWNYLQRLMSSCFCSSLRQSLVSYRSIFFFFSAFRSGGKKRNVKEEVKRLLSFNRTRVEYLKKTWKFLHAYIIRL